jgi:hypothetical protein
VKVAAAQDAPGPPRGTIRNVRERVAIALAAGLAVAACATAAGGVERGPRLAGCPVFPASNAWNRDVSRAPVLRRSDAYVRSIGSGNLHPDFAARRYGIPVTVVPRGQLRVPIRFTDYGDESDRGPYPVPPRARVEGGSDRHVIVVQRGSCRLYELYGARRSGAGWAAASGATWSLRSNRLRPAGWTSADAAGLPILPGLARAGEARAGAIRHALRVTVPRSRRAYIAPARHFASDSRDPDLPPMGLRLRLKRSFDLRPFHGQALVILRALKRYGLIVADNGSGWFITGAPDPGWHDADLEQLKRVPGRAFEAVQTRRLVRR